MGRNKRKREPKQRQFTSFRTSDHVEEEGPDETYDEVDQFHRKRDRLHLYGETDTNIESQDQEVLAIVSDDDANENEQISNKEDIFESSSDSEQDEENYLPSANAWGKKRRYFYNTGYVDPDFGGFSGSDVDDAELEEQEALTLQKKLMSAIPEKDYGLDDIISESPFETKEKTHRSTEMDWDGMSYDDKVQLFLERNPELDGFIGELKQKLELFVHLEPFILILKSRQYPNSHPILEKIRAAIEILSKYTDINNYSLNIQFYLYAKQCCGLSKLNSMNNHPVLDRIMQWKKLTEMVQPFLETDEINRLLERIRAGDEHLNQCLPPAHFKTEAKPRKNEVEFNMQVGIGKDFDGERDDLMDDDDGEKRGIGYDIEKNKGRIAKRRKDVRHSRIKRRKQYDKALIRRRAQVPDIRKETSKYDGEFRGINARVIKSIKLD